MLASFLPFTLWLLLTAPPDTLQPPSSIVGEALRAVEGDSAAALESRWKAQVTRDSADREAIFGLATLARLRYDYPTADQLYAQLLKEASVAPDTLGAYALLGLAQGLDARGLSAEATAALQRARFAARQVKDPAAEGEALLVLSLQRAFGEGIEAGLATLDTIERLAPLNRHDIHAERMRQRAALRGILGRPEARADAREALVLARQSGLQRVEAQALKSLAQLLQFEGKRDSSIVILRQAEESYRRAHDRSQLSTALLWHVNALLGQGDLGTANQLVHQALQEGQAARNQFAVASAYTAAGSIAVSLNDYRSAAQSLDSSIALFRQLGDAAGEMKARDYLAVTALAAGDIPAARRQTLEVLKWYQRTGESLIEFSAHRNLAIIAMQEGDWSAADKALSNAHALAQRMKRPLWSAELNYDDARLALFRGDLDTAERSLSQYLTTLDSTQHVFRHDARVRLADIYARRGRYDRAEQEASQAWDELERWRATLSDTELRVLAFQASPTEMSDRDAGVVRVLGELAQGGRVAAAFDLAERRRARELADQLAQATAFHPPDSAYQRSAASVGQGVRVGAAEVAALVPDDSTAILEYVAGSFGAPTTLFLLTRSPEERSIQALRLPPADSLEPIIARFEALVQNGADAGAVGRTLGGVLLASAVSRLGAPIRRLVVVPDGPLHRVPFDALRLPDDRYVAERFAISSAPSARVLATLWQSRAPQGPMRLLAFGDPVFAGEQTSGLARSASDPSRSAMTDSSLPRLRRSAREARLVAKYSPASEVRLREAASAAYLKNVNLTPFRVLHFATHALVDQHTAARTALVLAPGNGETGFVGPDELARLRLNADLVVLSSCRSGGGAVVSGEGVQGLVAPLFQAGARSVVATQWEIGDRSAVRFVESLYRHLAEHRTVGEALRLAKLDAIQAKAPIREWAAFMVVGDPLVRVPLQAPPWWNRSWFGIALALLGTFVVALYWLRSRRDRRAELSSAPGVTSRTHQR